MIAALVASMAGAVLASSTPALAATGRAHASHHRAHRGGKAAGALGAGTSDPVIYDSLDHPLMGDASGGSDGVEAYSFAEMGNQISFAGTARDLQSVVVTMSDFACEYGNWYTPYGNLDTCYTPDAGSHFSSPITLNIYAVNADNTPGAKIGSVTQTFNIPYRPSAVDPSTVPADSGCAALQGDYGGNVWYDSTDNICNYGAATNITFDFSTQNLVLPNNVIYGIAYNTSDEGYSPIGDSMPCNSPTYNDDAGCGYDSLNIGFTDSAVSAAPSVGSDPLPGTLYVNDDYADPPVVGLVLGDVDDANCTDTANSLSLFTDGSSPSGCMSDGGSGDLVPAVQFNADPAPTTTVSQVNGLTDGAITLGQSVSDTATVTGDSTVDIPPAGTLGLYVCHYPPGTPGACDYTAFDGGEAFTATGADSAQATSNPFTPDAAGNWCFDADYFTPAQYETYNASADGSAADECFTVNPAPTTTTSAPASSTIVLGTTVSDSATVTGNAAGGRPTGSVSFYQCGPTATPTDCTTAAPADQVGSAASVEAGPDSNQSSASSAPFKPTSTGYWCFNALYSGDSNYFGSADGTGADECVDVTATTSQTGSAPTNATIALGQADDDVATITGVTVPPTGTVTFYQCGPTASATACTSEANQVGGAVNVSPGPGDRSSATSASFTPTATGHWCFAAVYSGDGNYEASADATTDECVDVTVSGVTGGTSPVSASIALGASNSDVATVQGNATGGSPSGQVSFYECGPMAPATACTPGATAFGSTVTLTPGVSDSATATSGSFTPTSTGTWCFAASYPGDSHYGSVFEATTSECFAVTPASTSTTSAPTSGSIILGQSDSDKATVTGNGTGGSPTGTVKFYQCGSSPTPVACTAPTNQVGSAVTVTAGASNTAAATSASFTPTSTGYWCFAADYQGSSQYQASSDTSTTDECIDVTAATTTTGSAPTATTITLGQSDTDKVAVTGNATGGSPTGTVKFYVCGSSPTAAACTAPTNQVGSGVTVTAGASNTASATSGSFTPTSTGYWCFAAYYQGSSQYQTSSDTTTDECVDVTAAATTTGSTPTTATIVLGQTDTDKATVTGNGTGGSPTGMVSFYRCGPTLTPMACTTQTNQVGSAVGVTAGTANTASTTSASFTPTATGYWCLAAVYSGSTQYQSSADTTTDECVDVTKASTTTVSTPGSTSLVLGTSVTDGTLVTGNGAGGSPTGSVRFYACGPTATPTPCTSAADPVGAAVAVTANASDTATATSMSFTPSSTGYWCLAAAYSGDGNYTASSDTLVGECVDVTAARSSTVSLPTDTVLNLGQSDTDTAVVTGNAAGGSPTGTVSFYECGPTATAEPCASQADPVSTGVALTAGAGATATATSTSFTPSSTGYWCFAALYSGDTNYLSSSDMTTDECVNVVSSGDTVTTSSPATPSFGLGGSDTDNATVKGNPAGGSPGGSVSFYVCGPTAAATSCTSTAHQIGTAVTLTAGANDTATAGSASFEPTEAGDWCFAADYSGAASYFSSSDATTDECFDVLPVASTTGSRPSSTSVALGAAVTDAAAVTGNAVGGSPTGTLDFYVCGPMTTPTPCTSTGRPVGTTVYVAPGANAVSTATSASFTPIATGYWCFAADFLGGPNYLPSGDGTTDECVDVTAGATTTVSTPALGTIALGASDSDSVIVTGNAAGGAPTGTVSFYECGPTVAPASCASTAHQLGGAIGVTAGTGATATAPSANFTPTSTGYWCFAAVYSGSTQYLGSSDTTVDECVDVVPVPAILTILTASLPPATKGAAYSVTVMADGGTEPYTWSSSKLPRGLVLNKATGVISGTPKVPGTFPITLKVKDASVPREKTKKVLTLAVS